VYVLREVSDARLPEYKMPIRCKPKKKLTIGCSWKLLKVFDFHENFPQYP
jgi:hypothetical protein